MPLREPRKPRTPLVPLVPLVPDPRPAAELVPARRALSCSSALRRTSSRRRSSSAALRSRACCRAAASASMSCRSWVEPFQLGLRMSRWLCSVCERMRVQVLRRVEALSTVWETFCGWSVSVVLCGMLQPRCSCGGIQLTYSHIALGPFEGSNNTLDHLVDVTDPFQLATELGLANLVGIEGLLVFLAARRWRFGGLGCDGSFIFGHDDFCGWRCSMGGIR